MTKLIIAGSRSITDKRVVRTAIEDGDLCFGPVDEIVHGDCSRGVDAVADEIARDMGFDVKRMPAEWDEHGKRAGPIRNGEMAKYADALVAVWDGKSTGTESMINVALVKGLDVHVIQVKE